MLVFKIMDRDEWQKAVADGIYTGSRDDHRDGFIHLSAADQVAGTAAKHFADRNGLVLIAFDDADLANTLKWEVSRGGQRFPHVYGTLDPAVARWVRPMPLADNGHVIPPLEGGDG